MNPEPSLSAKWLELLKEIAPATSRVMVMLNADNVANLSRLRVIEASAPLFGLRVALAQVVSPTWLAHSTHAYIVMHFPCIASGIQHEQVECIVADEFIGRFIIDLHPFYFVLRLAAVHSMTSSARARSVGGISRPSGIAPLTYQRDSCPLPAGERRGQEAAAGSPDPPVGLLVSLSPQSK
jgi:hypothetical protein